MGRTLYCDCCGQDIGIGKDLYRVDRLSISVMNIRCAFDKINDIRDGEPYIICSDCFKEIGRKVQERNAPIVIEFEVEQEK